MNYKLIIAMSLVIFALLLSTKVLYNNLQAEKEKTSLLTINVKALERKTTFWTDEYGNEHSKSLQQIKTIADLKRSQDSTSIIIRNQAKKNDILLAKIIAYGELETSIKHDTLIKYKLLLGCHDLSNKNITQSVCINKDSTISSDVSIDPRFDLFWTNNRETINPPRKFFLWRWFQKKQDVISVEVISDNPIVKIKKQTFVKTIK